MINRMGKVLGGGQCCHSRAALGWWDITDIMDKGLQYQTILIFSLYMLRWEILGPKLYEKILLFLTLLSHLHTVLRALAELLTRLMTGWEREENEIHATAEEKRQREKAWGKKEDEYAIWGVLRQIALWGRLCWAHALLSYSKLRAILKLQAYVIWLHITHLPCHTCISFRGLCRYDLLTKQSTWK